MCVHLSEYMGVCVCVYVSVCVSVLVSACVYVRLCGHMEGVFASVYVYTSQTCVYVCMYACMRVCLYLCMCVDMYYVYVHASHIGFGAWLTFKGL